MKTYMPKTEEIQRKWYLIDGEGKVLGRLASEVAKILKGKNKTIYAPHVDTGDHVIITNAEKIVLTGKKLEQKLYRHHSLYPGGLKEVQYKDIMKDKPELAIMNAVKGMLPKNSLGRKMLKKLRVYRGSEHENQAQKPETLDLKF